MRSPDSQSIAAALRRPRNLILLGVFVLLIGVRVALPEVLRRVIVSQADTALVGRVELDDLDLSLLFGGATLEGLRVYTDELSAAPAGTTPTTTTPSPTGEPPAPPADVKAPLFSAKRLAVDISWLGLVRKTVEIESVELEGFAVRLDRAADGGLVLPAPVPADAAAEPVAPETEPASPWKMQVDALALSDGQIGFRDYAVAEKPAQFEIAVDSLAAKDLALVIDATGSKPGEIHLTAKIGGGTLGLDAVYTMKAAGPAVDAHIKLADFPIGGARVYLPDLGWSDLQGDLSAEIDHNFELGGAHTVSGRITLANVGVTVPGIEKAPLAWKRLEVEIGKVDVIGRSAVVSKVTLEGPYVLLDPLGQTPVPAVRLESKPSEVASTEPTPASPAAPAFVWKVEEIEVTGGRIDVLGGPQTLELGLGAKVSGLSSDLAKPAQLAVDVTESTGSIHLDGAFTAQPPGFDGGLGLAVAIALCVGCATARVTNVEENQVRTRPRPARVVVFDFDTGAADVRVVSSPSRRVGRRVGLLVAEPDLLAQAVADTLATRLVEQITALGLPAERAAGAAPPGPNDLVVFGQFVRIDEGSMTKRFVIGFGVGATELRTQVEIFQVGGGGWQQIEQFDTVAAGSRLPGAGWFVAGGAIAGSVATSAAISSGVGVLRELRASIDADAGRTAEQITGRVSELSTSQRW